MEFGAIVTDAGTRKIMEAIHEGKKVSIVDFAVGDGGGIPCTPDSGATGLINEIWRGNVSSCHMSEESENLLVIETVMPSDVGGFTIREMGIFDDEGILFAICNTPDTQKVKISDGVVHELNLIMEIALSNIDKVELIVDPCVLMATKKDIENLSKKMDRLITGESGGGSRPGFTDGIKSDNIVDAINEVFQSGNEAKNKLVENLIAMGISASTDETLGQLIDKVLDMTDTSGDTVVETALLAGYTAHNAAGEQIIGKMPEMAGVTVDATATTQDDAYTYFNMPPGHYNENSKVRSANSNLKSGVYYLGTGTSFDIKTKFPDDYSKFTADNFIIGFANAMTHIGFNKSSGSWDAFDQNVQVDIGVQASKSYNRNNGILSIGGSNRQDYNNTIEGGAGFWGTYISRGAVFAYLVVGDIN